MKKKVNKKYGRTEHLLELCLAITDALEEIEETHKTKKYKVQSMVEELLLNAARSGEYILKNMHVVLDHEGREEDESDQE